MKCIYGFFIAIMVFNVLVIGACWFGAPCPTKYGYGWQFDAYDPSRMCKLCDHYERFHEGTTCKMAEMTKLDPRISCNCPSYTPVTP